MSNPNNNFPVNQSNNDFCVDNFWLNPMMNNFNFIPQNSINPMLWGFPNNPMNNLQQSFNNFGGNMTPNPMNINPLNMSVNNFNINNNFKASLNNNININMNDAPFRKMNSAPVNHNNSEIQINFSFMNSQSFKVNAKLSEKLIDVINRFKISDCPKELREYLTGCLCHGQPVNDFNKTLLELDVKNGEQILFMKSTIEEERKKKEMKYQLTEREKEQVNRLKQEYDEKYLHKELNKKVKLNENENKNEDKDNDSIDENEADDEADIPTFRQFLMEKDRKVGLGIHVKEHDGRLVYILANKAWTCRICKKDYPKENPRYYCSICGYSMCEDCHYKKKYYMKKSFPEGTKPSNPSVNIHCLNTDYHPHRLVYCRTSRRFLGYNSWNCDNCRESFNNRVWSFYCTKCDFDLCCDCCGFH